MRFNERNDEKNHYGESNEGRRDTQHNDIQPIGTHCNDTTLTLSVTTLSLTLTMFCRAMRFSTLCQVSLCQVSPC